MKTHILLLLLISFLTSGFTNSAENTKLNNIQLNTSAIIQKQKLIEEGVTGESLPNDGFGTSVDIQGDIAVIGIPNYNGVGEVRIYEFEGSDWIQSQVLKPTDTEGHNGVYGGFGIKVILDNNRLVVQSTTGALTNRNSVSTFLFDGNNWAYESSIYQSDPYGYLWDDFSFKNDMIVAYVSYNQIFYVYEFINGNWSLSETVNVNNLNITDLVATDGTIFIGDSTVNDGANKGVVYIYEFTDSWQETFTIRPTDNEPFEGFGSSISYYNNRLAITSPGNNSDKGAVYIFNKNNNIWQQTDKISNNSNNSTLGIGIILKNDRFLVSKKTGNNYIAYLYIMENLSWVNQFTIPLASTYSNGNNISSLGLSSLKFILGEPLLANNSSGEVFIYAFNNQS